MEKTNKDNFYSIIKNSDLEAFKSYVLTNKILNDNSILSSITFAVIEKKRFDILKYLYEMDENIINLKHSIRGYNTLTEAVMVSDNKLIIDFLISKEINIDFETIRHAIIFDQDIDCIDKLINQVNEKEYKTILKLAKKSGRTDVVKLIDENYLPKTPEAKHQSSDIIIDFIDNSAETVLELPDATYELSHEITRDVHIVGTGNTKLKPSQFEEIFQVNQASVVLERLILEAKDAFLVPVINGKLVLKNCKLSIGAYGIFGEDSTIELVDCEIVQEGTDTPAHSVITIDRSALTISGSTVEVEIAFAQMKSGCKVVVEHSKFEGNIEHAMFYTNTSMDIEISDSSLFNAKAGIMVEDNSNIKVTDTMFRHFDRMIYCRDNNNVQVNNTEMKLAGSCIQAGRKCEVNIEDSQFSSADENHITIDQKSVLNVKRSRFDNANMAALSGLKASVINVEDSEIDTTIAGVVTQGGKLNIERTKFIEIDEEGAVRGVKNDMISLKDVIIDSSLTDIIVDKPRKLTQENVKTTNPVTIDDL
ncbi:right-handed parallel beta-helix repeat-containing protein [Macrococcoides canis]|uniref:right-handed parallel beta-helix repeat-containing protein n=1 Tax=Macrococcoides canis TaxID=1855823 RepID=UPI001AEBCBBF|nr:right-handed parallel beta-helix repeat-containing protein [Macrococcus canis]QTQ07257.1 right-handed parallel beta-helix repeat-containing protein [Macrococcus canis]